MNILSVAMGAINVINFNESVTLVSVKTNVVKGIAQKTETTIEALAQVQQTNPQDIKPQEGTFINADKALTFYINGDRAEVVNYFQNTDVTNTIVEYRGKRYEIFSKVSWINNGWIKVIGVLNDSI